MTVPAPDSRPHLLTGVRLHHDAARDRWVLLAPERVLELDAVAVAVLKRCTGEATIAAIVDDLAAVFQADRVRIEGDVRTMLADLVSKKVLAP